MGCWWVWQMGWWWVCFFFFPDLMRRKTFEHEFILFESEKSYIYIQLLQTWILTKTSTKHRNRRKGRKHCWNLQGKLRTSIYMCIFLKQKASHFLHCKCRNRMIKLPPSTPTPHAHIISERNVIWKFLFDLPQLLFLRPVTYLVNQNVSNKQSFCKANNKLWLITLRFHFPSSQTTVI